MSPSLQFRVWVTGKKRNFSRVGLLPSAERCDKGHLQNKVKIRYRVLFWGDCVSPRLNCVALPLIAWKLLFHSTVVGNDRCLLLYMNMAIFLRGVISVARSCIIKVSTHVLLAVRFQLIRSNTHRCFSR